MAKGNMLQGMARGKVGDVVFSRLDGEQVSRVRNRHPQNPKTEPQMIQRAIMATVMTMYSAGKEIFDHSFEGKKVGSGCQREFMSRNAKKLREAISKDFNSNVDDKTALGRVVAPGAMAPVPFSYQISNGTYTQNLFAVDIATGNDYPEAELAAAQSGETVAAYAQRVGLIPGDIYTIVAVASSSTEAAYETANIKLASTPVAAFGFVRLTVLDDLSSTAELTTLSQIFKIEVSTSASSVDDSTLVGDSITPEMVLGLTSLNEGALGVIRSRDNVDLRSESYMVFASTYGIIAPYITRVWQAGSSKLGQSKLILEGGNF